MQFSTKNNPNFEKPSRIPYKRTKVNIKKFRYLEPKKLLCVCSVIAKMFENRNSGKSRKEDKRKESIFFRILTKVIQGFDLGPKKL
jgi:hypothetical protein